MVFRVPSGEGFVSLVVEFAINATAFETDLAGIRPDASPEDLDRRVPWALAWRARAAAWQLHHRAVLEQALA